MLKKNIGTQMRRRLCIILSCILIVVICALPISASAATYWNTKLDSWSMAPYDLQDKYLSAGYFELYGGYDTQKKDFDNDGKKETVKLVLKSSANKKKGALIVYVNGKKKDSFHISNLQYAEYAYINIYKLGNENIAVLNCCDPIDGATGELRIYKWTDNDNLKLLKHKNLGGKYLHVEAFVSSDKKGGDKQLYICKQWQKYEKSEWTKTEKKKYKKWFKNSSITTTVSIAYKYKLKANKLVSNGKDNYHIVTHGYE